MKATEARNLSRPELTLRLGAMRAEYYTLAETVRLGKGRNHAVLKRLRRDVARALTILREGR